MSLRQAATGLRRILRHPCQIVIATRLKRTTGSGRTQFSCHNDSGSHSGSGGHTWSWSRRCEDAFQLIFLSGPAVLFLGIGSTPVLAEEVSVELSSESDPNEANVTGLRKVEDGSVVSNLHTSKWRVFTDNGRDLFLQGKLEDAERMFVGALQEAKEGFGQRDPHVASACNNLAELYRVKKALDKAEPLYLEAIDILEESYGLEDIRVGAALHNLGQFYLVQRKLEESRACYERALKIKRRILGENHTDYADTMYHLGMVLHLQGKGTDSEALIQDSVRILEEVGQGGSFICIRRMRYLAQIYMNSNRLTDAANIQRKILHTKEVSNGWSSLDTIIAAEGLALTLQSVGSLEEAQELMEKCLASRKTILSEDHIQIAANILYIARVEMLKSNQLRKRSISEAVAELDKAKDCLWNVIRIARQDLDKSMKQKGKTEYRAATKHEHTALVILLQALDALGQLEITKAELQESGEERMPLFGAENALNQCISAFKEFGTQRSLSNSPQVRTEYLSCLNRLSALLSDSTRDRLQQSRRISLKELNDEIKHIEGEASRSSRKRRN